MNSKNRAMPWIVGILIVAIIVTLVVNGKNKNSEETNNDAVMPTSEEVETTGSSTTGTKPGTKPSTGTPSTPPSASTGLRLTNPTQGLSLKSGQTLNITWEHSSALENANVTLTLLKGGKEITAVTEASVKASEGKFAWKIPDVSLYGTTGYSIKIVTVGLSKNTSFQTGEFTINQ